MNLRNLWMIEKSQLGLNIVDITQIALENLEVELQSKTRVIFSLENIFTYFENQWVGINLIRMYL